MSSSGAKSGANVQRSFKAVFIPADKAKAVEEWTITYDNASEVSCLLDRLKVHFAGGAPGVNKEQLRASVRQQIKDTLAKQNPAAAEKPIDDAMVDMILQMSAVDCVALQNNKASTNYMGLMAYVDDQGKAKGLPVNERATMVTMECGCPTQVLGDTLIARNFDDENHFRRVDFTLEEYFKAKEWRLSARKANEEKDKSGNAAQTRQLQELLKKTGLQGQQQQQQQDPAQMASMIEAASKRLEAGGAAAAVPGSQLAASLPRACSNPACDFDASMRCGRCHRSWYCSKECQKKDYKFHKTLCTPAAAPAAKPAAPAAAAPATDAAAPAADAAAAAAPAADAGAAPAAAPAAAESKTESKAAIDPNAAD